MKIKKEKKLPLFFHTADLHLKEGAKERFEVLAWIVEKAEEAGASLIIAGDLFDNNNDARILAPEIRAIFDNRPQVRVFIIPGNHDAELSQADYYGKNVKVLSQRPLSFVEFEEGIKIVAVPFAPGSRMAEVLAEYEPETRRTILIAHGTYFDEDFSYIPEEVKQRTEEYFPILPQDLEGRNFSYVALGHFHNSFRIIEKESLTICYPGSPSAITAQDVGKRKVARVSVPEDGGACQVSGITVPVGRYNLARTFWLTPGEEKKTISAIEAFLEKSKDRYASVNVELLGFSSIQDQELQTSLEDLSKKFSPEFAALKLQNRTISYKELLDENPLVREFVARVESEAREDVRQQALELGLKAFGAAWSR
jgi:DNA repair exonuclease SbcCD nuclease subunit